MIARHCLDRIPGAELTVVVCDDVTPEMGATLMELARCAVAYLDRKQPMEEEDQPG